MLLIENIFVDLKQVLSDESFVLYALIVNKCILIKNYNENSEIETYIYR